MTHLQISPAPLVFAVLAFKAMATKALTSEEQFTTYDGLMESVVNDSLKPVSLKYLIGLAEG